MFDNIVQSLKAKYPNVDIEGAVGKANGALNGADLSNPSGILKNVGITEEGINQMYQRYGSDMRAKAVLGMFGTSPDQLKNQALGFLKGPSSQAPKAIDTAKNVKSKPKFPKLF